MPARRHSAAVHVARELLDELRRHRLAARERERRRVREHVVLREHLARLVAREDALVQPAVESIRTDGEVSVIAIDGDGNAYMKIFNANKDQLSDPDKIKPGQVLKIPAN